MRTITTIVLTVILVLFIIVGIPYIMGYKIYYSTNVNYDFQAISAFGQWVSAIVPVALVFLSVFVTNRFDKTKRDINQQNIATVEYVDELIKGMRKDVSLTNEEDPHMLKEKAYKYVSIAGITKTENVAKHLEISNERAFELLNELLRVDGKISAGGRATIENIKNVLWLKKK